MQRHYRGENIAKGEAEKCSARVGHERETNPGWSSDETRGCSFITSWRYTDCTQIERNIDAGNNSPDL